MAEPGQLSVNDRVLIHLATYATDLPPEDYPVEMAQAGIAESVGISRTHVPRAVKSLIGEGMVRELTGRVSGHERRMSVYAVTPEGLRRAERIWRAAGERTFSVRRNGALTSMTGKELEELVGRKRALRSLSQMKGNVLEIDLRQRKPVRMLAGAPTVSEFCGRDSELRAVEGFIESDARVMVILGNYGHGTSTLARRALDLQDDADVLWLGLSAVTTVADLHAHLEGFARSVNPQAASWSSAFQNDSAVIVFDGYFSVLEEVVEFFAWLLEQEFTAKVLITAREETPAYNWFYQKRHLDSGVVSELRVRGLDEESAKELLGNVGIEREAFRRVYAMTRGQPMALKMLRENDYKGLKKHTLFTPEEIRYLLFLKDKKA